jgi:hypothetical protein
MSRQLNVLNVTAGSGASVQLQKPVAWDVGMKCRRIRYRVALSLTNSSTLVQGTTAFFLAAFQSIFGNESIQFGDVSPDVVDALMPFNQLRELYAFMEGKDVTVNGIGLQAITGVAPFAVPIAASTTTVVNLECVRSFTLQRAAQDLTDWCPGETQMKQMQLAVQPGVGATPVLSTVSFTSALVQVQVIADDMLAEGGNDVWASVARCRLTTTPGTTITLPLGQGGMIFALWDEANSAATYPLTVFDVKADGRLINGTIQFAQWFQCFEDDLPQGWFDPSVLVAPLFISPAFIDPNLQQTGEQIIFDQPNNDVTAPKLVVGFIPAVTTDYATVIGTNVQSGSQNQKSTFNLSNLHAVADTNNPPSAGPAASISPVAIVAPADNAFSTVSGTQFKPGALPEASIPNATVAKVAAQVSTHGGPSTNGGASTLAKATKKVAISIPGYSSPNRNPTGSSPMHNALAGKLLAGYNSLSGQPQSTGAAGIATKLISPAK